MILAALALLQPAVEARVLWVDATANLAWTIDSSKVQDFCQKAKDCGFNELVVDIKPINGKLLIATDPSERFQSFRDIKVPADYDLLKEFSRAARANGLRISAGINVLSEGHSMFPGVGHAFEIDGWQTLCAVPVFEVVLRDGSALPLNLNLNAKPQPGIPALTNAEGGIQLPGFSSRMSVHPDDVDKITSTSIQGVRSSMSLQKQTTAFPDMIAVFVDPLQSEARTRILNIVRGLGKYDIDGVVFDRLRYGGLTGGFGPEMQAEFAKRYGPVSRLPDSVFRATNDPTRPLEKGPRFAEWMQFRAEVITELLADLRKAVKETNAKWTLGAYVGAGWETYYEVGVNYATDKSDPLYGWAQPEYGMSGYARYLDFLTPGVFYKVARSVDPGVAPGRGRFTVEGGSKLMQLVAGTGTLVYPALYGLDWEGDNDGLRNALRAVRKQAKGIVFFDTAYILRNNWWQLLKEEFQNAPKVAPHALPSYSKSSTGGGNP